jgi:carbon-monoxide dehydrogenase small subunit
MAKIKFTLNHQPLEVEVDPSRRLLDFIREDMHLIGTKEGCGEGSCGACVVLMDGYSVNSCLIPMANVIGHDIITIDEFKKTKEFEVLYAAFSEEGGSQCGFCTPGMIIASQSLLSHNPHPSDEEIRAGLAGNLCRCTGYQAIINAVKLASKIGGNLWDKK